jgi:hypothetical protein
MIRCWPWLIPVLALVCAAGYRAWAYAHGLLDFPFG